MTKIARLIAAMRQNYALIMDADKNPLMILPAAQRFQIMVYLSVMWTTIFCAAFGIWIWYGPILAFHMLAPWGCYNGHDVRNCRPDTTARHEE